MTDGRRLVAVSAGRREWGVQVATFAEWYVFETAAAWRWVLEVESKKAESRLVIEHARAVLADSHVLLLRDLSRLRRPRT